MLVFQTSFGGESSGSVAKCRLYSQAISGCNLNGLRSGENLIILMFGRYLYKQSAFEIRFQLMEVLFSLKTYLKRSWGYRVFSHDVTSAILVSQNNETAAMLVSQTSPVGDELFSYANDSFCSKIFA